MKPNQQTAADGCGDKTPNQTTLKATDAPDVKWSVTAYCYDPCNPGQPCTDQIEIPANERSVEMPGVSGTKIHIGMPVDANLAVHFIKNFLDYYTVEVTKPQMGFESIVENMDFDGLHQIHKKHQKLLNNVITLNYGMTLDKDLILKMISQPKCEGLRFYLCGREQEGDMHLSLVTVGVDCEGYDLHYDKKDTVKPEAFGTGVPDLITQSLTGEYLTPPPPDNKGGDAAAKASADRKKQSLAHLPVSFPDDPRYCLLNHAKRMQALDKPADAPFSSGLPTGFPPLKAEGIAAGNG